MFENLSVNNKIILAILLIDILTFYLIPKIIKRANRTEKIGASMAFTVIFSLFFLIFLNNSEFEKLVNNYGLTKGLVERYIVTNKVSMPSSGINSQDNSITYTYSVGGYFLYKKYSEPGRVEIPDIKPDLTIMYLVIFEKDNPENSFMLFNYPIKNNSQFEEYKKLFEKGIPNNAFRNYSGK